MFDEGSVGEDNVVRSSVTFANLNVTFLWTFFVFAHSNSSDYARTHFGPVTSASPWMTKDYGYLAGDR